MTEELYRQAKRYLAGGVNSPVRAFKAVGGAPVFIESGRGSRLYDARGKEYIDYCLSWGAVILGHADRRITSEAKKAIDRGTGFGAPTRGETELAREICRLVPSAQLVRLTSSGTEAVMSAVRLARGYTGRDKVIKFAGCYHGHVDYLLVSAGSGGVTFGIPNSKGVPRVFARETMVLGYNDLDAVKATVRKHPREIACIIVEPVAGNMGVVPPSRGFLEGLRKLCSDYDITLIFDEVITGFRLAPGGAQEVFGVRPDLTCLGKILGGGFPIGAYCGKREIMECVSPLGGVYQAGTLSGNPVAVRAGLAALRSLSKEKVYTELDSRTGRLCAGLLDGAGRSGVAVTINRVGSMFTMFFTRGPVYDLESARKADTRAYGRFFHRMLREGVYLPPSAFESCFLSLSHTDKDIEKTVQAGRRAFRGGV